MIDTIQRLLQYSQYPNLCDFIDEDVLRKLGRRVCKEYKLDETSREDWKKRSEDAMDMALQVVEEKTFPWENASNVKTPLLTEAALQFHARAYPAVVAGDKIVKGKVTGKDQDGSKLRRADRVASHMNWQLTEEMPEWEEDVDKMLLALPIEGCEFKKIYYCPVKGRNVAEWIRPDCFVVSDKTKVLADCPRQTHVLTRHPHQIAEMQRAGTYREVELNIGSEDEEQETLQEIYEQHRLEDFDGDGVKEPYIVTVHVESQEVLRVKANWEPTGIVLSDGMTSFAAFDRQGTQVIPSQRLMDAKKLVRIQPEQYFVKYSMFPSPNGSFYDVGYGQLVTPLIRSIDSIINQIIDAGTLANAPPGLIAEGLKLVQSAGEVRFKPGEWKRVKAASAAKIADSVFQFQFSGASQVLFNMLAALIDQVKSITSISDAMTGASAGPNEPVGTTMARIDQGMKVFNAAYKRIYRSLGQEFKLLYRLNSIYMPPEQYFRVVDSPEPIEVQIFDYQGDDTDIQPVSDPGVATTMQRMAKAQFVMQVGAPNQMEAIKRAFEAAEIDGVDALMQAPQPPPDPKAIELAAKVEKMAAETEKIRAEIMEIGGRLDLDSIELLIKGMKDDPTRVGAMETIPGDQGIFQMGEEMPAGMPGVPMLGPGQPV